MNKFKPFTFRPHQGQRGQSLVELAISLTVILMLLSGAVDFGMAFFSYTSLRDAAQEGALYGSINGDANGDLSATANNGLTYQENIEMHVRKSSSNPVNLSDTSKVTVSVNLPNGAGTYCEGTDPVTTTSNAVSVTVGYDYPIVMPLLGAILNTQTIPLHAKATDTILVPPCP